MLLSELLRMSTPWHRNRKWLATGGPFHSSFYNVGKPQALEAHGD